MYYLLCACTLVLLLSNSNRKVRLFDSTSSFFFFFHSRNRNKSRSGLDYYLLLLSVKVISDRYHINAYYLLCTLQIQGKKEHVRNSVASILLLARNIQVTEYIHTHQHQQMYMYYIPIKVPQGKTYPNSIYPFDMSRSMEWSVRIIR